MIHPVYSKQGIIENFSGLFQDSNPKGLQIQSFFEEKYYRKLLLDGRKATFTLSEIRDQYSFFEDKNSSLAVFFRSNEFISFASKVCSMRLKSCDCSLKVFTTGRYTLAHYVRKGKIDFLFDLTATWNLLWGGSSNYITSSGDKLTIPPSANNLILLERKGIEGYITYVNHLALSNGRIIVSGTLD